MSWTWPGRAGGPTTRTPSRTHQRPTSSATGEGPRVQATQQRATDGDTTQRAIQAQRSDPMRTATNRRSSRRPRAYRAGGSAEPVADHDHAVRVIPAVRGPRPVGVLVVAALVHGLRVARRLAACVEPRATRGHTSAHQPPHELQFAPSGDGGGKPRTYNQHTGWKHCWSKAAGELARAKRCGVTGSPRV